jgi:CPA2 family monovalent cation:H+ antiporter-2
MCIRDRFSFILGALGLTLGILPQKALDLIVAGALVSIVLNSAVFWATGPVESRLKSWFPRPAAAKGESKEASSTTIPEPVIAPVSPEPATAPAPEGVSPSDEKGDELLPTSKTGHDIVVGYGVVGATILKAIAEDNRDFLLIEDNSGRVAEARSSGIDTLPGNAVREETLKLANIAGAKRLFVAVPETFESGAIISAARKLNPGLLIITRAHTDTDKQHLLERGASEVVVGAVEIARTMVSHVAEDTSSADGVINPPDAPEPEDEPDPLSSIESGRPA